MIVESSTYKILGTINVKEFAGEIEAKRRYKVPEIRKKEGPIHLLKDKRNECLTFSSFLSFFLWHELNECILNLSFQALLSILSKLVHMTDFRFK